MGKVEVTRIRIGFNSANISTTVVGSNPTLGLVTKSSHPSPFDFPYFLCFAFTARTEYAETRKTPPSATPVWSSTE